MKEVSLKLSNMRKPQSFVVYPFKADAKEFIIQSDKSIGQFNRETGVGVLNTKGSYFPDLLFAKPYTLTRQELEACLENQPKTGDKVGFMTIG